MTNQIPRYREDVLTKFFDYIRSGESFFVTGAPSAGKTRLMDFLMGDNQKPDRDGQVVTSAQVKKHYLGEPLASKILLARVDMNRLRSDNDWGFGFFELLLNTILFAFRRLEPTEDIAKIIDTVAELDSEVIESKDDLKAHRLFEYAVDMICKTYGFRICFLLDEFDETYQTMPRELFAHLRAVRDTNKYGVSYILFLRNTPDKLRPPTDNESFYELISRYSLGLGPFSREDAYDVIEQIGGRQKVILTPELKEGIYRLSGGHPGFIQALLKIVKDHQPSARPFADIEWYAKHDPVEEEFRKIWIGLLEEERKGFLAFVHGSTPPMSKDTGKLLLTKGLLVPEARQNSVTIFSPLFQYWISKQ
ncbi:MAG: ATP-binding protein [Anaerolineales bacterium]|nr:ATP-binding protein [Anaerolineales bacterium]MCB9144217.1 ATP-binding protein [Anaerolineales bacterium]